MPIIISKIIINFFIKPPFCMPDVYITITRRLFKIFPNKKKRLLNFVIVYALMMLYVFKWGVGLIVLVIGILFGLSLAVNSTSADIYQMSGATMISISFIILGSNIFIMGLNDRKKNKEIMKNKFLQTKAEDLSSKKRIDSYRNIR